MAKKKTKKRSRKADQFRVTRQQLADLIGVNPGSVTRLVARGMPCKVVGAGRGHPSVFDLGACLAWQREQFATAPGDGAGTTRDAYLKALTERVQHDLAVRSGELVPLGEVILAGQNYTKAWTAKIRALPRQMVQGGLIPREREEGVRTMLYQVLTEISRWKEGDVAQKARGK